MFFWTFATEGLKAGMLRRSAASTVRGIWALGELRSAAACMGYRELQNWRATAQATACVQGGVVADSETGVVCWWCGATQSIRNLVLQTALGRLFNTCVLQCTSLLTMKQAFSRNQNEKVLRNPPLCR